MSENDVDQELKGASRPRRSKPTRMRRFAVGITALLIVALTAGAAYVYSINRGVTQNITRSDSLPADNPADPGQSSRPTPSAQATGSLNYVLLGSDSRDAANSANGRSDSIMVVHLNAARDKAYIISFPRDMYVEIPGHGMNKINAAYSLGGAKLTVLTLEELLGVRMDHVALVDFEGFMELTDSLGGVTVKNAHAFKSHGFDYPKGNITIKGEQALWFVRERHSLPRGDLDRAENQRNVIKAIVVKGMSKSAMADPVKYVEFVSTLAKHVTVDSTLSNAEIRSTALSLNLTSKSIKSVQAPLNGFDTINGQDVDLVDRAKMKQLGVALRDDTLSRYVKKNPQS